MYQVYCYSSGNFELLLLRHILHPLLSHPTTKMEHPLDNSCLKQSQQHVLRTLSQEAPSQRILPSPSHIQSASEKFISSLPYEGCGIQNATDHLLRDIAPALNHQALSPNYYGFVTGGITPAARVAEEVVSLYDQNVGVHLPESTIATALEDRTLKLLLDLLRFDVNAWPGRIFTTGATASNIVGLACGREYIVNEAVRKRAEQTASKKGATVGEVGLLAACQAANITSIQILTTLPHSSLKKASSVVGLGRSCFHQVSRSNEDLEFDFELLEERLKQHQTASIVVISCAEVNTGHFATHSRSEVNSLRCLCDRYGAWLHVDAGTSFSASS